MKTVPPGLPDEEAARVGETMFWGAGFNTQTGHMGPVFSIVASPSPRDVTWLPWDVTLTYHGLKGVIKKR